MPKNIPLFWSSEYANLHSPHIQLVHLYDSHGSPIGLINLDSLQIDLGVFKSPSKATFGGFWPLVDVVDDEWLKACMNSLSKQFPHVSEFAFRFPPDYFHPEIFAPQKEFLLHSANVSRREVVSDVNQHFELNKFELKNVSKGNRKKIRQAEEAGAIFTNVSRDQWVNCYELLRQNRADRGVEISMSKEIFLMNLAEFANFYSLHMVSVGAEIASCSLSLRLCSHSTYVVFWGHKKQFQTLSPVAFLAKSLIENSILGNYQFFDLGVSSVAGIEDVGLSQFKSNLGAIKGGRLTIMGSYSPDGISKEVQGR